MSHRCADPNGKTQDDETRCVPRALGVAAVSLSAPRFLSCGGQPKPPSPNAEIIQEPCPPGDPGDLSLPLTISTRSSYQPSAW